MLYLDCCPSTVAAAVRQKLYFDCCTSTVAAAVAAAVSCTSTAVRRLLLRLLLLPSVECCTSTAVGRMLLCWIDELIVE